MATIRNPYDRLPEGHAAFAATDPDAPALSGAQRVDSLVNHQLRPRYGLDFFLRHTRHPGTLIIRTRPRYHPSDRVRWSSRYEPTRSAGPVRYARRQRVLPGERSRKRIVLAWRPDNDLLPTAITWAHRTVIDRSMLVDNTPGTRRVEVHLLNHPEGPVLVFPVLVWPPDIYRPHLGQRLTTQVCIPRSQLGDIVYKAKPEPRIHPTGK